jgi:hypothetical protein
MRRFIPVLGLLVALAAPSAHAAPPDAQGPLPPLPGPEGAAAPAPAPAAPAPVSAPAPDTRDVIVLQAPTLATHDAPTLDNPPPRHRPFYESGWFWGALGAAAFAGGAIYLATRDSSAPTIHLQMQVPH